MWLNVNVRDELQGCLRLRDISGLVVHNEEEFKRLFINTQTLTHIYNLTSTETFKGVTGRIKMAVENDSELTLGE